MQMRVPARTATGNGGTLGSIVGDVADNGTLVFNRADTVTFGGLVSGTGLLNQAGTGTTVLTNNDTYTGGTTVSSGTLQLGSGGTTGSIVGNVTDNGALVFNRSDSVSFDGIVSGTGLLNQAGTGTTVLTNGNTYTGGTTVSAGTLQLGNGGMTGSIVGDVTDNGTLAFNRSDTVTFGGSVTGTGALSQRGTGTTVLTNSNTYTGGTTVSAGALQIGNGGTTGSIVGDVTDNGSLIFNRLDDITYDGRITGSGSVLKQGAGTAILTSGSTYAGGTTISAGTLQLGNGGNSGSIVGDIVNDGTLAIEHSDVLPVVGNVSGSGGIVQRGTGAAVLLGTNSYSGPTDVATGALYVDGDQTAATGITTAASGSTLGGSGIIGGNVTIANGGALAPGQIGVAPGTLTINGNLNLSSGSILNYGFGQANVVGGALNDLTVVQGNVTLAGTLNVQTSEAGTFDPGIYRIISYAGSLTNNGLAIGTIPSPDFFVQASIAHQVNLINTAGLTFSYWDGVAGPKDDNAIQGGNGAWQNFRGNNNWTDELGAPNAAFADSTFAIFAGTGGTVTVDGSLGAVQAAGMQFAVNGYVLTGGPITLVGSAATPGESIIRVGDGTAPGASYVATIDSVLAGNSRLVKSDLGTLVMDGANAYTGGTQMNGGVLQVRSDSNLGASSGTLGFNGGTLRTTGTFATARATTLGDDGGTFEPIAGTTLTLDSGVSGTGVLTKAGPGTLVFAADNSYTNRTEIKAGTLQLGNGGTAGSIAGNVIDDGVLAFNRSDTYTYGGNIWGSGAVQQIGPGVTVMTGSNTYTGPTFVVAGTLRAGATNTLSPGSVVGIDPRAALDLNGFDETVAGLANAGLVRFGGAPGTTLRVAGNYIGDGGALALNTYLGSDGSPTDRLVIDGGTATGAAASPAIVAAKQSAKANGALAKAAAASGGTSLLVNNAGGPGARTTGDGILVVDAVNGATTSPSAFSLGTPVAAGPYEYSLYRGGAAVGSSDDWFLRSILNCATAPDVAGCQPTSSPPGASAVPVYRPETSLYAALPSLALSFGGVLLDSLHERMGGQIGPQADMPSGGNAKQRNALGWGRIVGITGTRDGGASGIYSNDGPSYDYRLYAAQAGMDVYQSKQPDNTADHAGLYVAYGEIDGDVDHFDGSDAGNDRISGATVGVYWTHFGPTGWYVDNVIQGTRYNVKADGPTGHLDSEGTGLGASVEGGYPIAVGNGVVIELQAQLVYQTIHLNATHDNAANVNFSDVESLTGRLGVRLSRTWEFAPGTATAPARKATAWVRASFINEFLGHPVTGFSSADGYVPFEVSVHGPGGKLDAGLDAQVSKSTSVYGSVQGQFTGGGHAVGAEVGVKVRF
ncbi:outer membrane autotransporter protein [Paraburkholderia sp. WSM4179]|nr:outer membrane autotransporter protein [Paraburkholderia sp. WSM4179]